MTKRYILLLSVFSWFFLATASAQEASVPSTTEIRPEKKKVKVFPNPATNVINVLGLANSRSAQIFISDLYGNRVQSHQWEIRNNALNIPIPTLTEGLYIISIVSKEQEVSAKFYKK
ncbi:T9SS type A sorting domain-containing protein [Poritiphilus flavus]|uniref:T9SS type A sorting domain-containing protein n=1 Tax=Poritiphilus flavus TaxID=2697053 RepID=A0A6L9E6P8_9FLAO|nr:T9SS type A sorting domain-containing protein [Poritiphilus flavus]NAS10376.1 T9SS type A sorting domain-containing protein [Poritiphilus flavus]